MLVEAQILILLERHGFYKSSQDVDSILSHALSYGF